ncbi:amidohydrolase family protein [Mariniflexile sp. AS56]|uniref:amidohydrolase family protein n=1 Tax=Mariniflexile sp. AS56 TaxID=3063957 RepID=UPI0026EBDC82|nr:amidohydrolase family protein [Mariniflexile sp. AS56]MDO7170587.1 amidohydrolase family protein [Mariniflexile sp. AS56]
MKILITYIAALCSLVTIAQQTPAPKQTQAIAIVGAIAHIGNGTIIENSLIILEDGKITSITDATNSSNIAGIKTIDAKGKHVYPGFIIPNSTLGLVEIDAVRASNDQAELGNWNPHIRSLIAYNAESKVVESMRPNGVLLGQIAPRSGRISGTSSIVQFDAWNWEDAAIKVNDGIHLNWPDNFTASRRSFGGSHSLKPNEKYAEQVTEITHYFNNAVAYNNGNKTKTNLPFEALNGIFDSSKKLYIHVDEEKGIIDAVNFSKENNIENLVIVGGRDAYKVTSLLKEHAVSIVLMRVHSLPSSEDEDYDLPYKSAKLLTDAGIVVALEASGSHERMGTRNLPFYAGTTVAHGLTKEQALQLITLNAAKILGIDAMYGTLEAGKSATLFVSEGDALDMRTNKITHAFIDGRLLSLETHQTELWERYSNKYNNQ